MSDSTLLNISIAPNPVSASALCLSGGGLRATFFHFGVVKALADAGRLKHIKHIVAVSGGSILAGHMIRNWELYAGQNPDLAKMEKDLRELAARGMRERVMRRYLITGLGRFRRYIQQRTIQKEYARILGTGTIADCYRNNPRREEMPDVHFMSTNFNSGEVCSFTKDTFIIFRKPPNSLVEKDGQRKDITIPMAVSSDTIELSFAVAASSAFPGVFPPMRLDAAKLGATARDFPVTVFLSDGGIYDNLGLEHYIESVSTMDPATKTVIVSNASGAFEWNNSNEYYDLLARNVRTVDILMDLMIDERWERAGERLRAKGIELQQANISSATWHLGAPPISVQQQIQNIRTDLNRFSKEEVDLLIEHGYRVARTQLTGEPQPPRPAAEPAAPEQPQVLDLLVKHAAKRPLGLFDPRDPLASVAVLFFVAAFFASALMILASPFVVHGLWTENSALSKKTRLSDLSVDLLGREAQSLTDRADFLERKAQDLEQTKEALNTYTASLEKTIATLKPNPSVAATSAATSEIKVVEAKEEIAYIGNRLNLQKAEGQSLPPQGNFQVPATQSIINKVGYRVWLQFAGSFTRKDMTDFGKELVKLWPNAPGATKGGERTENAASLLEVRYGPNEDEAAAIALTQDILDLKIVKRMNNPRRVSIIPKGSLEIWISR